MKLRIYKSLWGMTGPLDEQFERIKLAGYDGVESAAQEISEPDTFKRLLKRYGFDYVALLYTEGPDHATEFQQLVSEAMNYGPVKLVAHAGRDTMSFVKQIRFFTEALRVEQEYGIPIAHETHRRRPLFSPMNTVAILRELPDLRVNLDFSHWCCVTESLLADHESAIELAAQHAIHIHGRVGYENGPQVPDPRTAEWQRCVEPHERWWERAIASMENRQEELCTFVPEYGPPTYMQTDPKSGLPLSDVWEICNWQAARFRTRFNERAA
jgi:sugar phosphate isomerase/epimerase